MSWNNALVQLKTNIDIELHLIPNKGFKAVKEITPYKCRN